jgi:DNA-binding beta-propeller fold protein YncE
MDDIRDALLLLEKPVSPPPAFADALFERLLEEVRTPELSVPRLRRRSKFSLRLVTIGAAAMVIAITISSLFVLTRTESALAVVQHARARFARLPAFTADISRRRSAQDLPDLPAGQSATNLPDWVVNRTLLYHDATHWRNILTSNSYASARGILGQLGDEEGRVGDFRIADGTYLGTYLSSRKRLLVQPLKEVDPTLLRFDATDELSPELQPFSRLGDQYVQARCRLVEEGSIIGRRAKRIDCGARQQPAYSLWLDNETGLLLKLIGRVDDRGVALPHPTVIEVTHLDLSPSFAPNAFTLTVPPGARASWVGNEAPPPPYATILGPGVEATVAVGGSSDYAMPAVFGEGALWTTRTTPSESGRFETQLLKIDPARNTIIDSASIPEPRNDIGGPSYLAAAGAGYVWVIEPGYRGSDDAGRPIETASLVQRIDPRTLRRVDKPIPIGGEVRGFAVTGDAIWAGAGNRHDWKARAGWTGWYTDLLKIELATGQRTDIAVEGGVVGVTATNEGVWVRSSRVDVDRATSSMAPPETNFISRIDARTVSILWRAQLGFQPEHMASGFGSVWLTYTSGARGWVARFDEQTGDRRATVPAGSFDIDGGGPAAVTVGGRFVWVTNSNDNALLVVDPTSDRVVRSIGAGSVPGPVDFGDGSAWVADQAGGLILRINAS